LNTRRKNGRGFFPYYPAQTSHNLKTIYFKLQHFY